MKPICASHLVRFTMILIPISLGFICVFGYVQFMAQASDNLILPEYNILYVDAEADGAANGLNWINAYTTLQDALAVAVAGNQIWVAEGVYYPDEGAGQIEDAVSSTFRLVDGVAMYGGFDPSYGIEAFSQRAWETYPTVLSGDIDHETFPDVSDPNGVVTTSYHINGDNAYHVVSSAGVSQATQIDGVILTAGKANNAGGGMYNTSGSQPTISNLLITGNYAVLGGGMANLTLCSPALLNITFERNQAESAGGLLNWVNSLTATVRLSNVAFIQNASVNDPGEGGGGIYNYQSNLKIRGADFHENSGYHCGGICSYGGILDIENAIFTGNTAVEWGGGLVADNILTMTNVVFTGNEAGLGGGGAYLELQDSAAFANLTIASNTAGEGGGLLISNSGYLLIANSILWGNQATSGDQIFYQNGDLAMFSHSLIQDSGGSGEDWDTTLGFDGGENLDTDPLFLRNPGAGDGSWSTWGDNDYGDLHLQGISPAIDAGSNVWCPSTDLEGWPRPIGLNCDLGAYEHRLFLYFPLMYQNYSTR